MIDSTDSPAGTVEPTSPFAPSRASRPGLYRVSSLLRRAPAKQVQAPNGNGVPARRDSGTEHAPPASTLLGAALAVGAASGFLEMAVQAVQLQVLHRVDWTSLMFNRHAGWLVVVMSTFTSLLVTTVILGPALIWASWRRRRRFGPQRTAWTWGLAGTLLATLLLLGPLQAIHGFHPMAPVAIALGAGVQMRHLLLRRSPTCQRNYRFLGVAVIVLLPAYGFWDWQRVTSAPLQAWSRPAPHTPNLIWIVLDTLRADHMSLHGYHRTTTPMLDAWAKRGITFDMARSAAPWTLPSHVTMFTGLWPSEHDARVDQPYFKDAPTLAEYLRDQGYATGAVVANVRMCNQVYGVGRGFDTYIDYPWNQEVTFQTAIANSKPAATLMSTLKRFGLPAPHHFPLYYRRPARAITKDARDWLDGVSALNESHAPASPHPYFLFVNLMDAHGPYLPLKNANRPFSGGPVLDKSLAVPECGWRLLHERNTAPGAARPGLDQQLAVVSQRLIDLYDDCLLGMDAEIGKFMSGLEKTGMLANSWVVITSDHGEHFGDHDQFGHGSSLYNAMTHVPLILIPPLGSGEPGHDASLALRGRRISMPVSHRDLPRTIAALLHASDANPFPGRSLACQWTGVNPCPQQPVLSQLQDPQLRGESFRTENVIKIDSLIDGDHILIETFNRPSQLFQLFNDDRQEQNLAGRPEHQSRLEQMRATLEKLSRQAGSSIPRKPTL